MPKRRGGSGPFKSLKRSFATTRGRLKSQYKGTGSRLLRRKIHKDFEDLKKAFRQLGFGKLINFQDPPLVARRRAGKKR